MADIATLGLAINTQPVTQLKTELQGVVPAAAAVQGAIEGVQRAASGLGGAMAGSVSQTQAGARAAEQAAASYQRLAREADAARTATVSPMTQAMGAHNLASQTMLSGMSESGQKAEAALRGVGRAAQLTTRDIAFMGFQFQDIAVQAAMGMNPLMIALQQGTQIIQPFLLNGMKLGTAFKEAGVALKTFLLNPFLLAIAAIGALAYAGTLLYQHLTSGAVPVEDSLKRQRDLLGEIKRAYDGVAGAAGKTFQVLNFQQQQVNRELLKATTPQAAGAAGTGLPGIINLPGVPRAQDVTGQLGIGDIFKQYQAGYVELIQSIKDGDPDFVRFQNRMLQLEAMHPDDTGLRKFVDGIVTSIQKFVEAQRALEDSGFGMGSMGRGFEAQHTTGGIDERVMAGRDAAWQARQAQAIIEQQREFEQSASGIGARSPAEVAAAARAAARTQALKGDNYIDPVEQDRILQQGILARLNAEEQLAEVERQRIEAGQQAAEAARQELGLIGATTRETVQRRQELEKIQQLESAAAAAHLTVSQADRDRVAREAAQSGLIAARQQYGESALGRLRGIQETMGSYTHEIELVGKTAGEAARLTTQYELMTQAKLEAARAGTDVVPQSEVDAIQAAAEAAGAYANALAAVNLASSMEFERSQIGRSDVDQRLYSQLHSQGIDPNSAQGQSLLNYGRETDKINEAKDATRGFLGELVSGLEQGKSLAESMKDAFLSLLNRGIDRLLDQMVDAIFAPMGKGTVPGIADLVQTAQMTVNAASVTVNSALAGVGGGVPISPGSSLSPAQLAATAKFNPYAAGSALGPNVAGQLMSDFTTKEGYSKEYAAGAVGNMSHETGGFKYLQEINPTIPGSKGGFGWPQWTGPRRVAFEDYARQQGLDPTSYAANYGFYMKESAGYNLPTTNTSMGVAGATRNFSAIYEGQGSGMASRMSGAQSAFALPGVAEATQQISTSATQLGTTLNQVATQTAQTGQNFVGQFGSALSSAVPGGGSIGGLFGGLFGGGSSLSAGAMSYASTGVGLFHEGGIVGVHGGSRMLPAWMIAGAPRHHSGDGLAPDERVAVLQTGEGVASRAAMAASRTGSPGSRSGGSSVSYGDTNFHINGNPDNTTIRKIDQKVRAAQADNSRQLQGDWGRRAEKYDQLKGKVRGMK